MKHLPAYLISRDGVGAGRCPHGPARTDVEGKEPYLRDRIFGRLFAHSPTSSFELWSPCVGISRAAFAVRAGLPDRGIGSMQILCGSFATLDLDFPMCCPIYLAHLDRVVSAVVRIRGALGRSCGNG